MDHQLKQLSPHTHTLPLTNTHWSWLGLIISHPILHQITIKHQLKYTGSSRQGINWIFLTTLFISSLHDRRVKTEALRLIREDVTKKNAQTWDIVPTWDFWLDPPPPFWNLGHFLYGGPNVHNFSLLCINSLCRELDINAYSCDRGGFINTMQKVVWGLTSTQVPNTPQPSGFQKSFMLPRVPLSTNKHTWTL